MSIPKFEKNEIFQATAQLTSGLVISKGLDQEEAVQVFQDVFEKLCETYKKTGSGKMRVL